MWNRNKYFFVKSIFSFYIIIKIKIKNFIEKVTSRMKSQYPSVVRLVGWIGSVASPWTLIVSVNIHFEFYVVFQNIILSVYQKSRVSDQDPVLKKAREVAL